MKKTQDPNNCILNTMKHKIQWNTMYYKISIDPTYTWDMF